MSDWTRRTFLAASGAGLVACTSDPTGLNETPAQAIDARVQAALDELYATIPGTAELGQRAEGILVIPRIRQVGFWFSGAYGEGALMIGPAIVDYYSMSLAGFGFTFGAQEFNQALFFLSTDALQGFRTSDGWQLGVGASVAVPARGAAAGITTAQINRPIQEVVWGQRGLIGNVSLAGAKYSRITR